MARDIQTVVSGMHFLEGPRWHAGRIWFSDFYSHQVYSAREDGGDLRVEARVAQQPSGMGWLPDGRLLIVSMRDRKLLRREADGSLVTHADLSRHAGGHVRCAGTGSDSRIRFPNRTTKTSNPADGRNPHPS